MVDATQAMEGKYVNADLVRNSVSKKCVFIDEGVYEDGDYGAKLHLTVGIDGKQKTWAPNKDSVKNIAEEYGTNTKNWIGKVIKLSIGKINGKDTVNGMPIPMPKVITETV
jgi:hypothetical protein